MSRRIERVRMAAPRIASYAAEEIAAALTRAVAQRGHASLCLSGGTTPRATYQELAKLDHVPWALVSFFFGDERCVPPDHADSNFAMAKSALFDHVPLSPDRVFRVRGEDPDPVASAQDYARVLPDALDVLVLGIGEDGHTASLFPGSEALLEREAKARFVTGPKPPPRRITITPPVIAAARCIYMLASGEGKAEAVARALEGTTTPTECPALLARQGVWLMDHAAGGRLTGVLTP
ncbi:MAG TPA: 6-phosphogluconolactonase [Polyangiaceae bacterium]|nr:6-phosphogluconolactonase [Polyangiaceae bacterium]